MQRVIAILGSLGMGLMLAAAGLAFDVSSLFYSGIAVFVLMAALWLYSYANGQSLPQSAYAPPVDEVAPIGLTENERALWSLKAARSKAVFALLRAGKKNRKQAFEDVRAALLTTEKRFGIPALSFKGANYIPYETGLEYQIGYIDSFYSLLAEGHVEEAKRRASSECIVTFSYG